MTEENPPKSSIFQTMEFGFLEFVFITVVLILFFGTLNYFNMIPLSSLYPQLSFLPQRGVPAGTSQPKPTPSPTPAIPGRGPLAKVMYPIVTPTGKPIVITEQKAKTDLENLVSNYIKPAYINSNTILTKAAEGTPEGVHEITYTISWKLKNGIFIEVYTGYRNGVLQTNYQQFYLGVPQSFTPKLDSSNAITIAKNYFTFKIIGTPKCLNYVNASKLDSTRCTISQDGNNGTLAVIVDYPYEK